MSFVGWPEIEGFHNVRKFANAYPHLLGGRDVVRYRAKVKLHGTNAAIQLRGSEVFAQSRTKIITPGDDNAGFAGWVKSIEETLVAHHVAANLPDVIVFGEWCGPGIMKGVAINQVPKKVFAVFCAAVLPTEDDTPLIVNPDELRMYLPERDDIHILPWYGEAQDIPLLETAETLQPILDNINAEVLRVEACDPWVRATFDVEGTGEGLVYYPISHGTRKRFSDLVFKAKGEKHKNVAKAKPAQLDPAVADSIDAFATMVLTEARLEQGARQAASGDLKFEKRLMGPFLAWVVKDVEKETTAELAASALKWDQVKKAVSDKARHWYMKNADSL